jgi:competence ComEA-like helix-hairpin-helix protein
MALMALVIIGSGYRFYQNHKLAVMLPLMLKPADSVGMGTIKPPVMKITPDNPLDLNSASLEELVLLPGIGEVKAQRILDYRTKIGQFGSVNELDSVEGIGEGILGKLRLLVTTGKSDSTMDDNSD